MPHDKHLYTGIEVEKGRKFCSEVRLPYGIGGTLWVIICHVYLK